MTITIAAVLIILSLMTLIIFVLLKKEVKDINDRSKVYFTRKAQEYTDHINRDDSNVSESSSQDKEIIYKNNENGDTNTSIIYLEKKANYEIDDLLKMMKQIDNKFNFDNEELVKIFLNNYKEIDKEKLDKYKDLKKMKDYIYDIGVFQIVVNSDDEYIEKLVNDLRLMNEDVIVEYFAGKDAFEVEEFCNYLDYEIGKCDPTIYVYVGEENVNYNKLNKHIKTLYSKDIYKGIKVVYLNKLYDFSLS